MVSEEIMKMALSIGREMVEQNSGKLEFDEKDMKVFDPDSNCAYDLYQLAQQAKDAYEAIHG